MSSGMEPATWTGVTQISSGLKNGPDHAPQMTYEVKIEGYDAISATAGSRKMLNRPQRNIAETAARKGRMDHE